MLSHIGAIDIMSHANNQLAIPRGQPPPTQLPAEFQSFVEVYEITDSDLSGYVYVVLRYLLTKCTNSGRYNAAEHEERNKYLCKQHKEGFEDHEPAFMHPTNLANFTVDYVPFVRCLSCNHHKPLIGQHDTKATVGQTQQLLIVLSTMGVM